MGRPDPALSRNLKPPALAGGVFIKTFPWAIAPLLMAFLVGTIGSIFPEVDILTLFVGVFLFITWALAILFRVIQYCLLAKFLWALNLVGICVAVLPLMLALFKIGDYVHLVLAYPRYHNVIQSSPEESRNHITFDWGSTGIAGLSEVERTLYYDEDDKLAQYVGAYEDTPLGREGFRHLAGHFYLESVGH